MFVLNKFCEIPGSCSCDHAHNSKLLCCEADYAVIMQNSIGVMASCVQEHELYRD